jgi:hypothetical protein
MKTSVPLLAAIVSVVAGLSIGTSGNAQTKMSDSDYCHALVKAYTEGGMSRGSLQPDNATAVAIAQCQEGKPGPAIPVLEKSLRDARITLPSR